MTCALINQAIDFQQTTSAVGVVENIGCVLTRGEREKKAIKAAENLL